MTQQQNCKGHNLQPIPTYFDTGFMKIVTYIVLLMSMQYGSAKQLKTICTNENQDVALFFPNEIRQVVVGSDAFTFSYDREAPRHFGLLQGVKGKSSNLLGITEVGKVYSYFLDYHEHIDTLNYFIEFKERIGLEKPIVKIDFEEEISLAESTLKIDSLKVPYVNRRVNFEKFSEYHLKRNRNSLKKKRKNGLILYLQDLIYNQTQVYAVIEIKNKSAIDFEVDYLKILAVF